MANVEMMMTIVAISFASILFIIFIMEIMKELMKKPSETNMTVFICCLTLMLMLAIMLVGCAKCINTETSTVQVKVTNAYHKASYTTMHYSLATKTMLPQTHAAIYKITVEYDGTEYDIRDRDTYYKYSDSIGESVNGILETKKYDDGTVKYNIVDLE